jgi:CRISPR system Cascade subunit CasD
MHTLLLRLAGPLQSWGTQSRFAVRDTELEPSKSGVVGLLCAALGRGRDEAISDLAALRMGVRVDQEGTLARDFHTAKDVLRASGGIKDTELSNRYYLADARFLVGLESNAAALLQSLHDALRSPHWSLYLGRKAFVPAAPVWLSDGLRLDTALLDALRNYPWLGSEGHEPEPQLRLVLEDPDGSEVRSDQPLSFAERRFAPRCVSTTFMKTSLLPKEVKPCTSLN